VDTSRPASSVSFAEALRFWLKLGFISFGGPAGQIAIMHRELVEQRRWISEKRFLHALNYCMLLPGPEAQQLATYIGWLMHRTWGGIVAGTLFRAALAVHPDRLELGLCGVRQRALGGRAVLRDQAGGGCHRAAGGAAHRQQDAEDAGHGAGAVGDRAAELRRHRLPEDSVSLGGAGRGADRLDRLPGAHRAVCIGRGPWRGLGRQPSRP
jgi:hypothetical protein